MADGDAIEVLVGTGCVRRVERDQGLGLGAGQHASSGFRVEIHVRFGSRRDVSPGGDRPHQTHKPPKRLRKSGNPSHAAATLLNGPSVSNVTW